MHEFSIAEAILQVAREEADRHGGGRVRTVRCRIGIMRQVVPELLVEAFAHLAAEAGWGGASLDIQTAPVRVRCGACGGATPSEVVRFDCPLCGAVDVRLEDGDELEVTGLTLESGDGDPGTPPGVGGQ